MQDQPLMLTPKVTRPFSLMYGLLHVLAFCAVLWADIDGWYRFALSVVISASLIKSRHAGTMPALRCQPDGMLALRFDGEWTVASLCSETLVLPWLIVLRYRPDSVGRKKSYTILPASFSHNDDFRRLRVWLRWRAAWS